MLQFKSWKDSIQNFSSVPLTQTSTQGRFPTYLNGRGTALKKGFTENEGRRGDVSGVYDTKLEKEKEALVQAVQKHPISWYFLM